MKKIFSLLSACSVMASEPLVQPYNYQVLLSFPEPVVATSAVEAPETASAEQRGVHTLRITGDEKHTPRPHWRDQNELCLDIVRGSSCRTPYKLTFPAGTRYLGGEEMKPREFSFRIAPDSLTGQALPTAKGMAVLVTTSHHTTRESLAFSSTTPVNYEFRRVKKSFWSGKKYYGRRVAATVEPARVCDGISDTGLRRLAAEGEQVWCRLKMNAPLPGHVLVRPVEELPDGEDWALLYTGSAQSGIHSGEATTFEVCNDLLTGLSVSAAAEGSGELEMQLRFDRPVPQADIPRLFSRLGFSVEGEGHVTTSADGRERTLVVDATRTLRFRYAGVIPYTPFTAARVSWGTEAEDECPLAYVGGGMACGLRMRVSGVLPAVVDVTVPAGTTVANGAALRRDHVHRIALNPAWPQLLRRGQGAIVLPVSGPHKLRLPCANLSYVDVTLRRVAPERAEQVFREAPYDSRPVAACRYEYRTARSRVSKDIAHKSSRTQAENELESAESILESQQEDRRRWLVSAQVWPTRRYELQQVAMFRSAEMVLDLDTLAGSRLTPGMYVLTVSTKSNQHVQHALGLNGARADALDFELDIPLLVTGLNVITSPTGVLVTRFEDGQPVRGATLSQRVRKGKTHEQAYETKAIPHGFLQQRGYGQILTVRQGNDVAFARQPSYREPESRDTKQGYLFTDRPLYRPGETVYLRGMLRSVRDGLPQFTQHRTVELSVCRPNGETLCTQQLRLSDCGAFEAAVKLPEGEEDVMGDYTVRVTSGAVTLCKAELSCQVFRRDAFEATLTATVAKVAPQEMTLEVQADDYSGVPLVAAAVELNVGKQTHRLVTDAEGHARLQLPMLPEWLKAGELSVSGSVCNDRQEYVVLPEQKLTFSPADFLIRCEQGRVYVTDAATGAPLAREQRLTVNCISVKQLPVNPRAAFSLMRTERRTVRSCELVVPANWAQGVPLPPDCTGFSGNVVLAGVDAAGRSIEQKVDSFAIHDESGNTPMLAVPQTGGVKLSFLSPSEGVAHLFIGCGEQLRHVQQRVGKGAQSIDIALQPREEGTVSVSLVLPSQGNLYSGSVECYVQPQRQLLEIELQLPQGEIRPGNTVQLSGKVSAAGNPTVAEVTLYAVDAGMLSVAPYSEPDPGRFFAERPAYTFAPERGNSHEPEISPDMLSGVWRGEVWRGAERWLTHGAAACEWGMMTGGLRSGSGAMFGDGEYMVSDDELPPWLMSDGEDGCAPEPAPVCPIMTGGQEPASAPRLRTHFAPVAVWRGALRTDAEGHFSAEVTLPDTLTTYRVFAVAADSSGHRFGTAVGEFTVKLPVMITPGMPLFMSTGDVLQLPLSITNATTEAGTWSVTMQGCSTPQQVELPAGGSATLYFEVAPTQEGECSLQWQAVGKPGTDAVQGSCKVRFPAPQLKEVHHLELQPGQAPLALNSLFAPEVAQSDRAEVQVLVSGSPLLNLRGCMDFLLEYPYGCTEQRAAALLPWLLYDELAPFCPQLATTPRQEVQQVVEREIATLFARQCPDGGLGYWVRGEQGSGWASCYAALALTVAQERGYSVPQDKMGRLLAFVDKVSASEHLLDSKLAAARALGHSRTLRRELLRRLQQEDKRERPGAYGAVLRLLLAVHDSGVDVAAQFRKSLCTLGRDYRHPRTTDSTLLLLALHDYSRRHSAKATGIALLVNGERVEVGHKLTELSLPVAATPAQLSTTLAAEGGCVYALVRAKALPQQRDFPGVTEKGLQVTRVYEVQGADGNWQPAPAELRVGDVVRVTLTCAKVADAHEYLVLEDYLPACMEAINPAVPSQAAGLQPIPWSSAFDHREYLADRVRGFCTRWADRSLLNMTYYARVKRAGTATAPPAQAQLMYEPQVYGLSPNQTVTVMKD